MTNSVNKVTDKQLSTFQATSEETVTAVCKRHGEYQAKRIPKPFDPSSYFTTSCPTCSEERDRNLAEAKMAQKIGIRNAKIKHLLGHSGIPKRFVERNFDNFRVVSDKHQAALSVSKYFAEHFDDCLATGASLLFCGNPGTGKTHLAAAIASEVCKQGRVAVFTSVLKAVRSVKDTWHKNSEISEQEAYSTLTSPDLLILDEVGIQFGTDAEKMILFEILNGRYENVRPTIVISNLTVNGVTEYLGERVTDRLTEGGGSIVVFDFDGYRKQVLGDENLPKTKVDPVKWDEIDGKRVI